MVNVKKIFVVGLLLFTACLFGQPAFSSEKINLNTATIEQLMQIKGIGAVTAQKIVDYRDSQKFASVEELTNVQGIGDKTLERFRDQLTVEDQ
jgi:competence protein ComEA